MDRPEIFNDIKINMSGNPYGDWTQKEIEPLIDYIEYLEQIIYNYKNPKWDERSEF